jgi:hypothetical protein
MEGMGKIIINAARFCTSGPFRASLENQILSKELGECVLLQTKLPANGLILLVKDTFPIAALDFRKVDTSLV